MQSSFLLFKPIWFTSLDVVLEVVERTNKDEDHLLVQFRDVIPDHKDNGTELASDRDGVLRIELFLFVS